MKLGMMQPYAFPYLGYFQLIHHCDKWVVFDDTQFVRKSWVTRNRVLHPEPAKQWQYVSIPVHHAPLGTMIADVKIDRDRAWKESILGKLSSYRRASCYEEVSALVARCLDADCESIAQWNVSALQSVCEYLGISFDYEYSSDLAYDRTAITHPGQWALETAGYLGASDYVNPAGGHEIFRAAEFSARGVAAFPPARAATLRAGQRRLRRGAVDRRCNDVEPGREDSRHARCLCDHRSRTGTSGSTVRAILKEFASKRP